MFFKKIKDVEITLLCREDDHSSLVIEALNKFWPACVNVIRQENNIRPKNFSEIISGSFVISFRSLIILNSNELDSAFYSLNFHPAPPEYPGFGGYNFALYDEVEEFGVTLHEMVPKVDAGRIIAVKRFPVSVNETISSLKEKSNQNLIELLKFLIKELSSSGDFSILEKLIMKNEEHWCGIRRTRGDLDRLCRVSTEISQSEIKRRMRACSYPPNYGLLMVSES